MKFLQAFVAYAAATATESATWADLLVAVSADDSAITKTYTSADVEGWTHALSHLAGLLDPETADD